ncbi:MAG TPA: FliG C-terminal domain-containing protein [Pirellulales bacterium]
MNRNLRKAAVLVASLDPQNAAAVLAHMTPAQADAVRQAVCSLEKLDPREQRRVIEEFFRVGPLVPARQPSGLELDDRLGKQLSDTSTDAPPADAPTTDEPFKLLHKAPTGWLAPLLEREHPQTIAVVVSRLTPQRAAELLSGFAAELQLEIARRLVDLDETDASVLAEVEHGLESWLCQQARGDKKRTAGLTALKNILGAASPEAKENILANLARHDRKLAARVKSPPRKLEFAELEQLENASLGMVVRNVRSELLVLALAGAEPEFVERVYEVLPPEDAQSLAEALRKLGPTRLRDVEHAQHELAQCARHLQICADAALDRGGRTHLSVAV